MDDRTFNELSKEKLTKFHEQMLAQVIARAKESRSFMSKYYDTWDERHRVYRAERFRDRQDDKAESEGRPKKQVMPMTYAKIHTFKSFVLSLFTQRPRIFELLARGVEDNDYIELAEKVLDADVKHNNFERVLRQHVVDVAKFGVGVVKHSWGEDYAYVPVTSEGDAITIFGLRLHKPQPTTTVQKVLRHQGNVVKAVSPFDFLPDPRFPLTEIHKGEFCGDESDISRGDLMRKETEKVVAGIKFLQNIESKQAYELSAKRWMRRTRINLQDPEKTNQIVRLTEMQIKIVPAEFELEDGKKLGPETYPIPYLVWVGNFNRIIRCEPMGYLHGEFTYDVAQFDEDQADFVNQSLADVLDRLQETMDWYMNARVEAVTRTIDNQLIVDPLGVDMSTITNRSRVILLKKGAARTGVDRYIKQLNVQDVTQNHLNDIGQIMTFMQAITGVNENAMGQYHSGRRSATEARVVAQGASSRLKEIASSIWASSIEPLGRKMLLNLRQGLEPDYLMRVAGMEWAMKPEALAQFSASSEDLVKQTDFFVYDGTLSSEKAYLAQTLKELFEQVISLGPTGLLSLEVSPKLMLEKIYELLGVGSLSQFDLRKDPQTLQTIVQQMIQQIMMQQQANGPQPTASAPVA
jgi:hypothetical protein